MTCAKKGTVIFVAASKGPSAFSTAKVHISIVNNWRMVNNLPSAFGPSGHRAISFHPRRISGDWCYSTTASMAICWELYVKRHIEVAPRGPAI